MGAATAGANMNKSAQEGQALLDNFFAGFSELKQAIDQSKEFLKKNEYVEDFLGRRRHLPEVNLPKYEVKLKNQENNDELTFNPFLICSDREYEDSRVTFWKRQVNENIKSTQKAKADRAKLTKQQYEDTGEMSNKQFEKLAKEALEDDVILQSNTGKIAQTQRQCFNARIQGCLDGDVRVQTKEFGFKKLKDLENKTVELWDGNDWTTGTILSSGKKLKNSISFTSGQKIICSPDHKFLTISTYGTESFKKCSELKAGDRVLVNSKYCASDKQYSIDTFKLVTKQVCNSNKVYLEDITKDSSFYTGRVLSDILKTSYSLANELEKLDITHRINENIFEDAELLRGFISGVFDNNGDISGNNITLTFGLQHDFNEMISNLQKALLFYGIRSTHKFYKHNTHKLVINRADSLKFTKLIGFSNVNKQQKSEALTILRDNRRFNGKAFLIIKDIERSNELIDMYDVCNTDRGYFVADGLITHNSAASLTKLAMIDIANDEILNNYQTRLIIPVHDELLVECPEFYASEVEKRLPEVMINAAKRGGDDVPQSVDPYNVTRWAADVVCAFLQEEFKKLEHTLNSREAAIEKIKADHPEIPEDVLLKVISGELDEVIF